MVIGRDMVSTLQEEGIKDVDDLDMVGKNFFKCLTYNLKRPGGQIIIVGVMVATPDFKFGAKLHMRLEDALNLVKFYKTVGISITNIMIQWDPIIKDFKQKWEILVKRKEEDVSDVPKVSKALTIIKWKNLLQIFYIGLLVK